MSRELFQRVAAQQPRVLSTEIVSQVWTSVGKIISTSLTKNIKVSGVMRVCAALSTPRTALHRAMHSSHSLCRPLPPHKHTHTHTQGVSIPKFARFGIIKASAGAPRRHFFKPFQAFLNGIRTRHHVHGPNEAPHGELNFAAVSVRCRTTKDIVRQVVTLIVTELGHMLRAGVDVNVLLPTVGTLRGRGGDLSFSYVASLATRKTESKFDIARAMEVGGASEPRFRSAVASGDPLTAADVQRLHSLMDRAHVSRRQQEARDRAAQQVEGRRRRIAKRAAAAAAARERAAQPPVAMAVTLPAPIIVSTVAPAPAVEAPTTKSPRTRSPRARRLLTKRSADPLSVVPAFMHQSRLPLNTISRTRGPTQSDELDRLFTTQAAELRSSTQDLDSAAAESKVRQLSAAIQRAAKERYDVRVTAERHEANTMLALQKTERDSSEKLYYSRPNLVDEVTFTHPLEPTRDAAAIRKAKRAIGKELRSQMRRNQRRAQRKKRNVVTQQNFFLAGVKQQCVLSPHAPPRAHPDRASLLTPLSSSSLSLSLSLSLHHTHTRARALTG